MSELAISSSGLTKRFRGGQVAVDALELRVPSGAVYGFLGPNGSGKTTTIRMLLGLVHPTSGSHSLLSQPVPESYSRVLPRVGALVEGPAFHPYLSGRANLMRLDCADRHADPATASVRIGTALERVGLSAAAAKRYRNYSLGMRQRLAIAATLLQPRDLLVLDEPTNGLDPQGTREVRQLVADLAREGTTVFVSSHLLSEVEQMCSDVGVMSVGKMVWQGSMAELISGQRTLVKVETSDTGLTAQTLTVQGHGGVVVTTECVTAELGEARPEDVVSTLVRAGVGVRGFAVTRPDLEEIYVELTGSGFDVSG
jgi:ABC-2 type transport system ATP-binding protein